MKVYLDDIRPCPEGWVLARNYEEAIKLLRPGKVTEISLDHDLGMEVTGKVMMDDWDKQILLARDVEVKSGYDVACWIEMAVFGKQIPCPKVYCHSANPPGKKRILQVIAAIERRRACLPSFD